jgi:hypothetical protein
MIVLSLVLLLFLFFLIVSEYDWKGAILFTIFMGFLQDPLRKASAIDSSYFAGISLFFFALTFVVLKSKFSSWDLELICWPNPILISLLPIFLYLLVLQGLNSFARFGDVRLTTIGFLFYTIPLISLWIGYRIAIDLKFLRLLLLFYIFLCFVTAISIFISLSGVESYLLKEVGTGIEITGTGQGFSGLWRTSEIAGWHLAAGASFSFILGMAEAKGIKQAVYFLISALLSFLTIATGRRKSLGLVIIFVSLYLIYYSLSTKKSNLFKAIGTLTCVVILSISSYGLVFNPNIQETLEPFFSRSTTLTVEESQNRLNVQGIGSIIRGFEIAGPLGYGIGVGSNTGTTDIGTQRKSIQSAGYVSEGGGGRLILELGSAGILFVVFFVAQVLILYVRIFILSRQMLTVGIDILSGLSLFTFANVITFFSASQLYSDPFVLIILGISSGAILAVPKILHDIQINSYMTNLKKI